MKKIVQKITGIIALSAGVISYAPAFANEGDVFFDLNKEFPLHIGL